MAQGKKSFIAYSDWYGTFKSLPDEIAGKLIKHIFSYVNDENPSTDDYIINALFEQIKSTLKRDLVKWETQTEQRVNAGKRSAELRALNKINESSTVVENRTRKSTVSDNVNVSVNDNVNDIINSIVPIEYFDLIKKWVDYKKEKKQQYKKIGLETLCRTILKDYPNVKELELAINHSISNGWSGLFKDKNNNQELAYKSQYPPLMTKNEQRFNKFQEASDGAAAIIRAKYGIEEDS